MSFLLLHMKSFYPCELSITTFKLLRKKRKKILELVPQRQEYYYLWQYVKPSKTVIIAVKAYMKKKFMGIRQVLAQNLKKNRQRCCLTQEKLAEKAGISAHYLAMVEVEKKFPTPEMLDKLAQALDIDTVQLFDISATPEGILLHLEQSIISNIEHIVSNAIKRTLSNELKIYEQKNIKKK